MLKDEQIKALWSGFNPVSWAKWHRDYLDFLTWAQTTPEADLRTEAAQKKLWNARVITPAGYGDSVNVSALLGDPAFVSTIVGLRTRAWPQDVNERAAAIQGEYESLVGMAVARGVRPRPYAKLQRLLGALIPGELTCVLNYEAGQHAEDLLLGNTGAPSIMGQVKMRARLRAVLGDEKDLAGHVRRSTFCWWLHENHETLAAGGTPEKGSVKAGPGVEETDTPATPLVIWPFTQQFKGNFGIRNFGGAYQAVVQGALPGLSQDQLVEVLRMSGDFETVAPSSLRLLILRVKGLGFLEDRGGLLFPTKDGEELVGSGQYHVLVERLIERIFGYPQLLRFVSENPGTTEDALVAALQSLYPNWTTPRVPTDLRNWCLYLGLIERDGKGGLVVTQYGAAFVARLPKDLPKPTIELVVDAEPPVTAPAPARVAMAFPDFAAIIDQFKSDAETSRFVFEDRLLASLDAAWRCHPRKRFVLLSGLSGTGKTAITLCYTRAVCELMGIPVDHHREIVPVSPDWRDPSGLLGYFNALHADPTFQAEPALRLVLRAVADPGRPYFLILDEMNLARVERYFAPFLSAMETGKDLVLHANTTDVNDVPPRVPWPANLHIAGTVNMDETTHPFSDKVLDRAFTLELWDVDLPGYFERQGAAAPEKRDRDVEATLIELHDAMRPVRRHFGYRTAGEVLAFMAAVPALDGAPPSTFLDQAVFSKVLPRLRGEQTSAFQAALADLAAICKRRDLRGSAAKIEAMAEMLQRTGVTRFWA